MIFSELSVLFESNKTKAIKAQTEALKENTNALLHREAVEDATQADDTIDTITRIATSWDLLTTSIKGNIKAMLMWLATTPAGWVTAAGAVIFGLVKAYDYYNISAEEAIEISEEAQNKIDKINSSYSDHKKIIEDCAESYDALSKGVDLSTNTNLSLSSEDYEKYLDITNQLAETFPSLVKTIDENGNAILTLGQNGRTASEDLKELLKAEENISNYKIAQNIDDLFGGVKVKIDEATKSIENYKNVNDQLENSFNNVNKLAYANFNIGESNNLKFDNIDIDSYTAISNAITEFYNELSEDRQSELFGLPAALNISNVDENGLYDIYADLSLLTDDEKSKLQNEIKVQAQEISDVIFGNLNILKSDYLEKSSESELAWKDFLPSIVATMKSLNTFQSLDANMQEIALKIVSNLDSSVANEIESSGSVDQYLRDYIISSLYFLEDKEKAEVSNAFNELLTLNPNDLEKENQEKISRLIKILSDFLKIDENKLRIYFDFEIDKDFQNSYKNSVQETMNKFGIDQTETEGIFTNLGIDTQNEVSKWNEIISRVNTLTEAIKEYKTESSEPVKPKSTREMINQINSLSDGFEQLDKIMESIKDEDPFDYTLLDDKALEEFKSTGKAYDEFIETVSANPKDLKKCQDAFNNLVTEWVDAKAALEGLSDETAQVTIDMLTNMGVTNASEVVYAALAVQKARVAAETKDFSDLTLEEIEELAKENGVVGDATNQWGAYFAQKMLDSTYNGQGSIEELNRVVKSLGLATNAWSLYYTAMEGVKNAKGGWYVADESDDGVTYEYRSAEQVRENWQAVADSQYEQLQMQIQAEMKKGSFGGAKYGGGTKTNDSGGSSKDDYKETFDFFERRVEVLTKAFDGLSASMENVLGANAKNTILDAQAGILAEEVKNYGDALAMYAEMANRSLEKVDESLRDKIKNGAVELTDLVGENGEAINKTLEEYVKWAGKIQECSTKLENLKKELAQLELAKFNNIAEEHTNRFDLYGNASDLINKQIGLFEEAGELAGEAFYEGQINLANNQLDVLDAKKTALANQLAEALRSGNVEKGSEEWLEMVKTMTDLDGQILETKTSVEQLNNAILEINWSTFERIQTRFGEMESELQNLVELFSDFNEINVSDGKGTWTDEAIATLGLYAQQYEIAKYKVEQYVDAIEQLKDDYSDGKYSSTEYADKLAELNSGQWDAVKSAEAMEDAIMDLNRTRVDEEIEVINEAIEAYREYTDSQIEALEAARDLHEYEKSITEKTKNIADIEKKLAAMQNDTSAATIAKRKQLEAELSEAKKDLEETEYDHSVDTQIDALNKNYEAYEEKRNAEIEALEESLKNREAIISQSFETIKQNADLVGQEITIIAQEHGVKISESLTDSWESGENAIASYGDVLNTNTSAFIVQLMNVEQKEWDLQTQANNTSESLANMFTNKADGLVAEFDRSTTSANELNEAITAIQNNLVELLDGGFDLSGIVSNLEEVKDAANSASKAISSIGSGSSGIKGNTGKDNNSEPEYLPETYQIVDASTGKVLVYDIRTADEAKRKRDELYGEYDDIANIQYIDKNKKKRLLKFAKGGIVEKGDETVLDTIAKNIGEDKMVAVKEGEGIFTQEQTKALLKLAPVLDNGKLSWLKQPLIPTESIRPQQNISYQYGSLVTVNGNIDDTNMQKMVNIVRKEMQNTFAKIDRDHRYSGY